MTGILRHRLTALLVSLVLGLSMTAAAFAHRPPSVQEEALRGYLLSGGSLEDLCGGAGHPGGDSCPLCPLAQGAAPLPRAVSLPAPAGLVLLAEILPLAPAPSAPAPRDPARQARAPPFVLS